MTAQAVRPVDTTFHASLSERTQHPCLVALTPAERFVLGLLSDSPKSVAQMYALGTETLGSFSLEEVLDLAIGLEHSGCVTSSEDEDPVFFLTADGKKRWLASLAKIVDEEESESESDGIDVTDPDVGFDLLIGSGIALLGVVIVLSLLMEVAIRLLH